MDTSVGSRQNQEPSKKILQGLPDSFITAMRRLFDLLDIEQAGRVHIHGMYLLNRQNCRIFPNNKQIG